MSRYDDEEFLPWYRKATVGWLELSAAARGVLVSISMELNTKNGTLVLRRGLPSLAVLLRMPWETIEPALAELVAAEKLAWNGSTFTLSDPEYMARRRGSSADRMARKRARDASPVTGSDAHVTACDASDASDVTRSANVTSDACDVTSPLLSSDLISSSEADQDHLPGQEGGASPPAPAASSADPAPQWFADVVATIEASCVVDLRVPDCWLRYAGHRAEKGKRPTPNDARYWLTTVMVPEAREATRRAARDRERDKRYADHVPKTEPQTAAQAKAFQAELMRRLAQKTGTG